MTNKSKVLIDETEIYFMKLKDKIYKENINNKEILEIIVNIRKKLNEIKSQTTTEPYNKLRSVKDTYMLIKENDPDTSLTESGLRRLIRTGDIPFIKVGRNIKLNYDSVIEYMKNPTVQVKHNNNYGNVRRVV